MNDESTQNSAQEEAERVAEEAKENAIYRYEIVDTRTGEKVADPSFILTPTGERMKMLTEPGHWVGAMRDIGVYYHDNDEMDNSWSGHRSLPVVRPIVLDWMARRIIRTLATLGPNHPFYNKHRHHDHMETIRDLGLWALSKYDEYERGNSEYIAERERKNREMKETYRRKYGAAESKAEKNPN